jgi:hypothetical protein
MCKPDSRRGLRVEQAVSDTYKAGKEQVGKLTGADPPGSAQPQPDRP